MKRPVYEKLRQNLIRLMDCLYLSTQEIKGQCLRSRQLLLPNLNY